MGIMDDSPWLDPREARAWRGWLAVSELLRAQIARDLWRDSGLSDADFGVLVFLSEHPERRVRMSDLAAALRWSKSRLSHQVGRMERRGLIGREECPSDARGSFAVLTAAGLVELERAAPSHVSSVRRNFIDLLSEDRLTMLSEINDMMIDHLLALPDAPAPPVACHGGRAASGPDGPAG